MPIKPFSKLAGITRFSPREFRRITSEMYRKNLELAQINRTLSLLNAIDLIVLQPENDVKKVFAKITTAIVTEYDSHAFAAVFSKLQETGHAQTLVGRAYDWLPDADQKWSEKIIESMAPAPAYNWTKKQDVLFVNDEAEVAKMMQVKVSDIKLLSQQLRAQRFYITQLVGSRGVIGTLIIGLRGEDGADNAKLLSRVSDAIGMALDNKLLQEENEKILYRLQDANKKLRKLDQTKDDFISMASHQLRTPLTSVKGYVSMVLDGDAGRITAVQRKLLTQSFISSQRMVYLISDLLNVSRLRTGKFIIEPAPTNLVKVIEEEVEQLMETVKGRNLKLAYHKPEHFPTLMLDETKLRQVIMNFIDNAVYYTPSGGHIDVYLEEKPKSIEFRVVDNGIGVPKQDQHHLFSKFYRARNAKRARPDGTGLGIFMAKKVIIAQGGAVVFKSQEGKGSTFGFTFPKAKLLAPQKAEKAPNRVLT